MRRKEFGLMPPPLIAAALLAAAKAPEATPATRYRALVREYQDAQQVFFKALGAAKTDAERRKALARKPSPAEYAERFLELAKANPADAASFDALNWILTYSPQGPAADEGLERVANDHIASPRLGPIVQRLATARSRAAEDLLRAAIEKNPGREVKAQACYRLATLLAARALRPAATPTAAPGQDEVIVERDDAKDDTEEARKSQREEATTLFTRLAEDYGTLKFGKKKTYGDLAREGLNRLNPTATARRAATTADSHGPEVGLEVGMTAPEIEGLDTNGRPLRLGAYRGNVVVLDFWGDW